MAQFSACEDGDLEHALLGAASHWMKLDEGTTLPERENSARDLLSFYQVISASKIIHDGSFRRIALQFPDSMLPDSFAVCSAIERALDFLAPADIRDDAPLVFVLGDTSYGECCVDEVAAQHLEADIVVHFGNACLSPTRALPVLYNLSSLRCAGRYDTSSSLYAVSHLRDRIGSILLKSPSATRVVVLYDIEAYQILARSCCSLNELELVLSSELGKRDISVALARPRVEISSVVWPHRGGLEPSRTPCVVAYKSEPPPAPPHSCDCVGSLRRGPRDAALTSQALQGSRSEAMDSRSEQFKQCPRCDQCSETVVGPLAFSTRDTGACAAGGERGREDSAVSKRTTAYLWLSAHGERNRTSLQLRNAAMKLSNTTDVGIFAWNGEPEGDIEPVNVSKELARRYHLVELAREAERIGIVSGTLGVAGNLAIVERCKRVIERASKRWYSLVVGKASPSKLGNFAEIDVFVLVACPQNALLDSKDFMRPIITPLELEVALGFRDWFAVPYSADFADVLGSSPQFSHQHPDERDGQELAMSERGTWDVAAQSKGSAADFLRSKRWIGLDPRRDSEGNAVESLPTHLGSGRSGVAAHYEGEG